MRHDLAARVRRHFEHQRYFVVAAGKGAVDLVAVRKSWLQPITKIATVLFIRCKPPKHKREPFEQKEKTELIVLAARYGAAAVWAERIGRNVAYKWL